MSLTTNYYCQDTMFSYVHFRVHAYTQMNLGWKLKYPFSKEHTFTRNFQTCE